MFDVHVVGQPPGHARDRPHHLEVLGLRCTHHVEQVAPTKVHDTVSHRGQVGGRVSESVVLLLHNDGEGLALTIHKTLGEYDLGAV